MLFDLEVSTPTIEGRIITRRHSLRHSLSFAPEVLQKAMRARAPASQYCRHFAQDEDGGSYSGASNPVLSEGQQGHLRWCGFETLPEEYQLRYHFPAA